MAACGTMKIASCFVVFILVSQGHAQSGCSDPAGVANAVILTSSPYAHGDLVTYRCDSDFSMTGAPSQQCSNGAWSGTAPTCTYIGSSADVHEQTVDFQTDTSETMMYGMGILIGLIFLIMVILLVIVICILCRYMRSQAPRRSKPKKGKIKEDPETADSVATPRMVDLVDRVRNGPPAKEVQGWLPFSKPIREINTSTK